MEPVVMAKLVALVRATVVLVSLVEIELVMDLKLVAPVLETVGLVRLTLYVIL
jgi:hypothetical protein